VHQSVTAATGEFHARGWPCHPSQRNVLWSRARSLHGLVALLHRQASTACPCVAVTVLCGRLFCCSTPTACPFNLTGSCAGLRRPRQLRKPPATQPRAKVRATTPQHASPAAMGQARVLELELELGLELGLELELKLARHVGPQQCVAVCQHHRSGA